MGDNMILAAKCAPVEGILADIQSAGYTGMVVSEAMASFQTRDQFTALKIFFNEWAGAQ